MNQAKFNKVFDGLTPRRKEVLLKLLAGNNDKAISVSLGITEPTIRKHIEEICKVFELKNEPGEHFSLRPDLIKLFRQYKPELVKESNSAIAYEVESVKIQRIEASSERVNSQEREPCFVECETLNYIPQQEETNPDCELENIQAQINNKLQEQANISKERLFGIEKYLVQLTEYLRDKEGSWFISVAGSGGVGKTSIVEKLVREHTAKSGLIDIAWVTAKRTYFRYEDRSIQEIGTTLNIDAVISDIAEQLQIKLPNLTDEYFSCLQNKLNSAPYLIVIDNLETLQDYKDLLTKFNPYSQKNNLRPSKLIFTSRHKLKGLNVDVREVEITGIDMRATLDLIRYKGADTERISQAADEELLPIYYATNGIPILILLVYTMIATTDSALDEIIQSLIKEKNLHEYLYGEALVSISDKAFELLRSMTRFSASIPVSRRHLQQQNNFSDDEFQESVKECTQRSLLTSITRLSGEPCYLIHNLLYEFIRSEETSV